MQGEGVEVAAHLALERIVDHALLFDPRFADEGGRDHLGGVMVAIAGEVADFDDWRRERLPGSFFRCRPRSWPWHESLSRFHRDMECRAGGVNRRRQAATGV